MDYKDRSALVRKMASAAIVALTDAEYEALEKWAEFNLTCDVIFVLEHAIKLAIAFDR